MPIPSLTLVSAFVLGLLHSLEPSHAKAVLASYFLNRRRTLVEALVFALTVTLAHTVTIFAMALAGFFLGPLFSSDSMETWSMRVGAGLMMAIGFWMFWSERKAHFHADEQLSEHGCQGHFFHHHDFHHHHAAPSSLREIFFVGFCSGAVPCMSGLAVLVMAWTTHSPARGVLLVTVFSLGLGLVVLASCVAMQQAARMMERYWDNAQRWTRYLPILSSALIFLVGTYLLATSLSHPAAGS